jgi:two-component system sensor histidine kinase UhpB
VQIFEAAAERLNIEQLIAIYRIVQEQLNNILKYSEASQVLIQLTEKENRVHLLIRDNGKGFEPSKKKTGIGLSNVENRAAMLNGEMKIISGLHQGCELKISFPLSVSEASIPVSTSSMR